MSDAADNALVRAIDAQARLQHAYFLGLQLMVSTRKGAAVMGEWMFRLFRRQHHEKFLSSFGKLGLSGLPHAVACARYHVLSNGVGGVAVQYIEESDRKAWVRFRYPRWMYDGVAICGVPVEVSRGFLNGWYAHNGVSLGNPRLGFVCVSEDMTGEYGLCGYFREFDQDLSEGERLQFRPGEIPPPADANRQPVLPAAEWDEDRRRRAARNYAIEYVRNGLCELAAVIGFDDATQLGSLAGRLIGMQFYPEIAKLLGTRDGGVAQAVDFLSRIAAGVEAEVRVEFDDDARGCAIESSESRLTRNLAGDERALVQACWFGLCAGALRAHETVLELSVRPDPSDTAIGHARWRIDTLGAPVPGALAG